MNEITSLENPKIKKVKKLQEKKNRDKYGQFLLEGETLIKEAIEMDMELEFIFTSAQFLQETSKVPVYKIPEPWLRDLADTVTPQRAIAVCKKPPCDLAFLKKSGNIVVLDQVQDPGNLGTIIRTADAAGFDGVILIKGCVDLFSNKVIRSTAGSIFRIKAGYIESGKEALGLLKENRKDIICTLPKGTICYNEIDMRENAAIIIGNEANGVSETFIEGSDFLISIPMAGSIESLNASVASGIVLYESFRQRGFQ